MTSPSTSTKVISTRVPTDDYFEIARIAHENHMNISDYVFMLVHTFKNQSTISEQEYNELKNQLEINSKKYRDLVNKWNDLIKEKNKLDSDNGILIKTLKSEIDLFHNDFMELRDFLKRNIAAINTYGIQQRADGQWKRVKELLEL